jgi:hypothetical protein
MPRRSTTIGENSIARAREKTTPKELERRLREPPHLSTGQIRRNNNPIGKSEMMRRTRTPSAPPPTSSTWLKQSLDFSGNIYLFLEYPSYFNLISANHSHRKLYKH